MSTSKHIDVICVVVLLCTLLLTGAFMCGRALGIQVIRDADADTEGSYFTANDLNGDWDATSATRITLTGDGGSVKGNGAYVYDGDVHIVYAGQYVLSGELTDGSVIVDADGDDKIWIMLDGVDLHCEDSAAILVEQADKVFLTLAEGSENTVSSGVVYSEEATAAGIDGAIYSRDDLTINGGGALTVTAECKHGIVANDDLVITGGTIDITAPQDGIHAHDSARFAGVDLTINAGDDGITVSNDDESAYIYIESGNINIPTCYEGIEAIDITIAGGTIDIRPTDDGINANGRGQKSIIRVTGGDVTIINESGRDADGLDSNGSIDISGGNLFVSVNTSSYALDYGSENGGICTVSGGTVIAAGGSTMAEGFDAESEQNFIMYNTSTAEAGTVVTLENQAGETLVSETIPCAFSNIVISTPELQLGETCTITIGDSTAEITVDNTSSSGGFGMGGMFGGGRGGFGGGRGGQMTLAAGQMPGGADTEDRDVQPLELPAMSDGDGQMPEPPAMPDGDTQLPELPTMSDGDGQMPEPPAMPDGNTQPQDMSTMPDGNTQRGQRGQMDGGFGGGRGGWNGEEMPQGDFDNGVQPQMGDDEMPALPDGEAPSDRQTPDGKGGDAPEDMRRPENEGEDAQLRDSQEESADGAQKQGRGQGGKMGGDQFAQWGENFGQAQGDAAAENSGISAEALMWVGVSMLALLAGLLIAFKIKH